MALFKIVVWAIFFSHKRSYAPELTNFFCWPKITILVNKDWDQRNHD